MYPSAATAVVDEAFLNRQLMSQVQNNYAPNIINPGATLIRPVAKTFPVARDPYAGAPFMHPSGIPQPNPAMQQQRPAVNQAALMQAMLQQQQQQQIMNSGNGQASYLQNNNVAVAAAAAAAVAATQQVIVFTGYFTR